MPWVRQEIENSLMEYVALKSIMFGENSKNAIRTVWKRQPIRVISQRVIYLHTMEIKLTSRKNKSAAARVKPSPKDQPQKETKLQAQPLKVCDATGQIVFILVIDSVTLMSRGLKVNGWSWGDGRFNIKVDGVQPSWRIDKSARPDVVQAIPLSSSGRVTGFSMACSLVAGTHIPRILLYWQAHEQSGQCALSVSGVDPDGCLEHIGRDLSVSGWALLRGADTAPEVQLMVDGCVVATSAPDITRPDLISANLTRERAGFQLSIPPMSLSRLVSDVQIVVAGQSLPSLTQELNLASEVCAQIKRVREGSLELQIDGWPGILPTCTLKIDGIRELEIDYADASTVQVTRSETSTVIRCPLPNWTGDGQLHAYCAQLRFADEVLLTDTVLIRSPDYLIFIDHADLRCISGWALRRDQDKPLQLGLYQDQVQLAKFIASIPRQDVESANDLPHSRVGFEVQLPETLQSRSNADFEIRDQNTGLPLARVCVAHKFDLLKDVATCLAARSGTGSKGLQAVFAEILLKSSDEQRFTTKLMPVSDVVAQDQVVVVVPVYGGATATAECLESTLSARNATPIQFVVINDCSPDPLIVSYLHSIEARNLPNVTVIHRKLNGGFSQSVNIGMVIAGRRDVILLNADTVVQDGWVDRLVCIVKVDPHIATVTPLSNNAEIATIPYICQSLPVATSALAQRVDAMAAQTNTGVVVDIPVAIGFCMYIRRACIDEVGLFDAETWGRGYGEEVDFCLKATALGWRHVLAPNTFIVHRGNVSFGSEKLERVLASSQKISAQYPFYDSLIQRFLTHDPVRGVRRKLNIELLRQSLPVRRVLHVTHSYGGGTEQYVQDIAKLGVEEGVVPVFLRFHSNGRAELTLDVTDQDLVGLFRDVHTELFDPHEGADLKQAVKSLAFERMHLHSPFGISTELLDWLCEHMPYDVTVHDYAWICPRVNLTYPGGVFCREPEVVDCNRCVARYGAHVGLQSLLDELRGSVHAYRQYFIRLLSSASDVYTGAVDVSRRLHRHGIKRLIKAGPHPAPSESPFAVVRPIRTSEAPSNGMTHIAVFGAISEIKGYALLFSCVNAAALRKLPFKFFVFGYTMDDSAFEGLTNITILGKYKEDDLEKLVDDVGPHVSLFLHQWPETYSYTLSHSQRLGIWPITLDIGAPAERVRSTRFGSVIPFDGLTHAELTDAVLACASRIHSLPKGVKLSRVPTTLAEYRATKAL